MMRRLRSSSALRSHATARGFTLIEAIVVLALTGIVAAMVGVFITRPIDAYVDLARRAELSDVAEMALRRATREIGKALPNSVRVDPSGQYLEFIPVVASGRYRAAPAADGSGDFFNVDDPADNSFEVLGPAVTIPGTPGIDPVPQLVIYNLGIPQADVYAGDTRRPLTTFGSAATLAYDLGGVTQFPYPSPSNRFQVVMTPVTYVCAGVALGGGTLRRYTGYLIQNPQPTSTGAAPLLGLTSNQNALMATHVDSCSFSYTASTSVRMAMVTMRLTLSSGGEKLTFVQQAHVDNSP